MAKLSVIVPVYNTYPYLRECLDSIINQTHKNLEIIIVNDASPYEEDDIICKEYAERDNRIIYIKHIENQGPSVAKKTGIQHAAGKYITFVDSDDFLLDLKCYEILIKEFDDDLSLIVFNAVISNGHKNKKIGIKPEHKIFNVTINELPILSYSMCNKIYLTKHLKELEYNKPEQNFYEDNLFWIEYVSKNNVKAKYMDYTFYNYRINNNSITKKNVLKKDIKLWIEDIYKTVSTYQNKENTNKFIIKYIQNEIDWKYLVKNNASCINDLCTEIKNNLDLKKEFIKNNNNLLLYAIFIEDEEIRQQYLKEIKIYKTSNYKHIKPTIELICFKINREIKRVINQIKNLFIKQ